MLGCRYVSFDGYCSMLKLIKPMQSAIRMISGKVLV